MRWAAVIITAVWLLFSGNAVYAAETQELFSGMDFSELSEFLEENGDVPVTFEEVVEALLGGGEVPYKKIGDYLKDLVFLGFAENQKLALMLLVVSLAFSILKSYAKNFSSSYLSEICFLLCYSFMMVLLLKSFSVMHETVLGTSETMVTFMKLLVPTYCMAISCTLNISSSAAAYTLIFTAIYLVEWLIRYLLVPLVEVYVMLEFLNHLMEEERFRRLSGLIADAVRLVLKGSIAFILGINIIQGMIAPAMDRLTGNTVARTIQMVPGIGNVVSNVGQIFLSSALVIKNCVGAAALIILLLLCVIPFCKMFFLAALYKILSAVLEPVSDKRLSGGMNGIANGGMLYLKIMNTCLILFFLTIALTSAATGLGVGK
ncbi:MAG: hypothetical protein HFI06_08115 [Eubacterium sp.]|jgi:stage III sporulation protein AE|nr:hypothetical protein [Eubacterium sp.]NBI86361.1 hypothetical protein [Lachnospiraceae bacterium]